MGNSNAMTTLMDPNVKLTKGMSPKEENDRLSEPYQNAVGALMYAALGTRPDISYAVGVISYFSSNLGEQHWRAVKRIFRYLKGMIDFTLTYSNASDLEGYSDADWAGDHDDWRSTTGYIFKMSSGTVTWNSKKQSMVALSSTEAEYMLITQAMKEAIWINQLLSEIRYYQST